MNSSESSRTVSQSGLGVTASEASPETAKGSPDNVAEPQSTPTSQPQGEGTAEDTGKEQVPTALSAYQFSEPRKTVPVSELLDYIRSTFDDESVLDSLPLEVAGNPSAWHARRAHHKGGSSFAWGRGFKKESPHARLPGDWHWDGIWAKRVRSEIEASHSDQMLFGNPARGSGDELVCVCPQRLNMARAMG